MSQTIWTLGAKEWTELKSTPEVYNDIKQGILRGETYGVRGEEGEIAGYVAYDRQQEILFLRS